MQRGGHSPDPKDILHLQLSPRRQLPVLGLARNNAEPDAPMGEAGPFSAEDAVKQILTVQPAVPFIAFPRPGAAEAE